jgi:hypothetical protein
MFAQTFKRLSLAVALGIASAATSSVAASTKTITKSEVRSAEPSATHRHLRDVVWTLFEEQDYRRDKAPTRPLSTLFLRTKIHSTEVPGLCRYDGVRVEFEPINPTDKGPDVPARASGITSTSFFTFLSPPTDEYEEIAQGGPVSLKECEKLPEDHPFFAAEDENQATAAYRAWLALSEALRTGAKFPMECDLFPVDKNSCGEVIGSLQVSQLTEVETCDAQAGTTCYKLYFDDRLVSIKSTGHVSPGPPAGQIVSAKLDSLIVLSHEIID